MHLSSPTPQQSTRPPPPPRQAALGHVGDSAGRGRSQASSRATASLPARTQVWERGVIWKWVPSHAFTVVTELAFWTQIVSTRQGNILREV